jgi:hypothetical protein
MKYFVNINSAEELRKMYRELVITMHPDKGGNAEEFAEMQNEYDNIKKQYEGSTSKAGRGSPESLPCFLGAGSAAGCLMPTISKHSFKASPPPLPPHWPVTSDAGLWPH